jgi:hypothetical protein
MSFYDMRLDDSVYYVYHPCAFGLFQQNSTYSQFNSKEGRNASASLPRNTLPMIGFYGLSNL